MNKVINFFDDIQPLLLAATFWALVLGASTFGAVLGGDISDSMKCRCDVGMVTYQ